MIELSRDNIFYSMKFTFIIKCQKNTVHINKLNNYLTLIYTNKYVLKSKG